MLAFAPGSVYDSINYQRFASRFSDFLYVERIVVSAKARSQAIGSSLYRDVFGTAASLNHGR